MKRAVSLLVYVLAVLAVQQSSRGQDSEQPAMPQGDAPSGFVPSRNSLQKFAPKRTGDSRVPAGSFNGFSTMRAAPSPGLPGTGGFGHNHYPQPMDRYTNWYRPRAATLGQAERCAPDSFRPRGLGHLFADPCDGFRMDYEPYSLSDGTAMYGPAYINRLGDPRCPNCLEELKSNLHDEAAKCAKCGRKH
ncbi:MAG: hypothetical protein RL215_2378 [Planctomycetota bacterium]